ncbi:cation diffusion facilitator family transporter [Desulfopila sp. IMCC35006]|uniref:cation diffusion facilitator family transporter n=1 Tax=Desulfopila sp. IMCC35006 TaxID=2569542 RepID=UPI0010AB676D|nr:cation diffusion facilitator family transporter [Desulfopila sp. IMCC35006]TKB23275.1 cation diffusion facilitator family transporter [Desulfopila sp. IMCC35006]
MESSEKTAWLSILTNLLLVAIKTAVAFISGSVAVVADAIHSLSDVLSSSIILIGIKISARPARGFPYGLYKVENLVAMVTSVLIFFAGYEIIKAVFLGHGRALPTRIPLAAGGIGATIVISWLFSRYELKKGKETGSPSLIADARHIWTDMLSSAVILMALLGSAIGFAVDRYAAVIVVLFIARSALRIFLDSIRVLLDASLDYNSLARIREIVLADSRVANINTLWARNAGRYIFVELDLTLRVTDLEEGHRLSEEIENRVKMEIGQVDRVLIHFQPQPREILIVGIPLADDRLTISAHFGEAPLFRLLRLQSTEGTIIEDVVLKNPCLHEEKAKGIKVAQWLLKKGMNMLISNHDQVGKGPGFVLGNAGVEMLLTKETDAAKALTTLLNVPENNLHQGVAQIKKED